MMRLPPRMWPILLRVPKSSDLLVDLSSMVGRDISRQSIAKSLEVILGRYLKRTIVVVAANRLRPEGAQVPEDGTWKTGRATVAKYLKEWGCESDLRLMKLFGREASSAAGRISALVPVLSSESSRLATVVVGRRRILPVATWEVTLIVAAVGMATLLFEQVRLRDMLRLGEGVAEALHNFGGIRRGDGMFTNN